jgi:hypothetical protein
VMPTLSNACCNVGSVVLANTGGAASVKPAVTVMTANGTETSLTRAHAFLRPITGIFPPGNDAFLASGSIVNGMFRFASRAEPDHARHKNSIRPLIPVPAEELGVVVGSGGLHQVAGRAGPAGSADVAREVSRGIPS